MTLLQRMNEKRKEGNYLEAFRMFPETGNDHQDAFQAHFLGMNSEGEDQSCLLLEGAAAKQAERIFEESTSVYKKLQSIFPSENAYKMYQARMKLIEAFQADDLAEDAVTQLISEAVDLYRNAYQYGENIVPASDPAGEPVFISKLIDRWKDAIRKVEEKFRHADQTEADWDDPVLLMVAESLYYMQGSDHLTAEGTPVESWVLLAGNMTVENVDIPEGYLARLVIEKVPGGCGLLYPDCRYSGYLPLAVDFRQGLRNVMTVLKRRDEWSDPNAFKYNYRWRLIPLDPASGFKMPIPVPLLSGQSAEAAFACAVLAAAKNERLDNQAVISAYFDDPDNPEVDDKLCIVASIKAKLLAFRQEESPEQEAVYFAGMKTHHLHKFVLFGDEEDDSVNVQNWPVKLSYIETFDEAYRLLSDYCRITDHLNGCLRERAEELLEKTCSPYVRSSLARMNQEERKRQQLKEEEEKTLILTKEEVEAILKGEGEQAPRIQILAESGLGKSTMLIEAEYLIAASGGDRIPVRLGAGPKYCAKHSQNPCVGLPLLSDKAFKWDSDDKQQLMEKIFEELFGEYFDQLDEELKEKRNGWLHEKVIRGELVFLLDALDQTDKNINLRSFFNADSGIRSCPLLLTGRPEIRTTKRDSITKIDWETLWVEPFDEERIGIFWRDAPYLDRLLETEDWEPLRTIPILLHRMKELAKKGYLDNLKNREQIYHRTLRMLLQHGQRGAEDAGLDEVAQSARIQVEKLFSNIAWETIQLQSSEKYDPKNSEHGGNFTGELGGSEYLAFLDAHEDQVKELHQINLTYRQTYTDAFGDNEEQFAWRHLSFCEWFAGVRLAGMKPKKQEKFIEPNTFDPRWRWIFRFALSAAERQGKQKKLDHLATCLLKYGAAFLLWEIIEQDKVKVAPNLELLCRWLVHRDRDGRNAWEERPDKSIEKIDVEIVEILQSMFACDIDSLEPKYRDSRWLHPAWELITANLLESESNASDEVKQTCQGIHNAFLSEFEKRVVMAAERNRGKKPREWTGTDRGILQLVPEDCFIEELLSPYDILTQTELDGFRTWTSEDGITGDEIEKYRKRRDTFNQRLRENKVNYCLCPPHGWERPDGGNTNQCIVGEDDERKTHTIPPNTMLQRIPMTNLQFEVFDPHHIQFRQWQWRRENETDKNQLDDHPVVEVSFYMSQMMAIWMTGNRTFGKFDLPDEWDWEACCKAGRDGKEDLFGIPWTDENGVEHFDSLSSNEANFNGNYPEGKAPKGIGRNGTIPVDHNSFPANGFSLGEMHGQLGEWCEIEEANVHDNRSLRGGSWFSLAWYTRTSNRYLIWNEPDDRNYFTGLRILRTQ